MIYFSFFEISLFSDSDICGKASKSTIIPTIVSGPKINHPHPPHAIPATKKETDLGKCIKNTKYTAAHQNPTINAKVAKIPFNVHTTNVIIVSIMHFLYSIFKVHFATIKLNRNRLF
jgi:hypothetical protein